MTLTSAERDKMVLKALLESPKTRKELTESCRLDEREIGRAVERLRGQIRVRDWKGREAILEIGTESDAPKLKLSRKEWNDQIYAQQAAEIRESARLTELAEERRMLAKQAGRRAMWCDPILQPELSK